MVKKNKKIGLNATLAKVLEIPGAEEILAKHKVPCLTCPMAKMEMAKLKISEICKMYGLEIEKLLTELNEV